MLFENKVKEEFNVSSIISTEVEWLLDYCAKVYKGQPDWEDEQNHIKTVNFAKSICSETARLTTLGIGVHIDGSTRAEWLQQQVDKVYYDLRKWVEYGCAYGTVILKPNGDTIKLYVPGQYEITEQDGSRITGAVFHNSAYDEQKKRHYLRLEYHRFENGAYVITNKCFVGNTADTCDKPVDISATPWSGYLEEARIVNVEKPLFAALNTPQANNLEPGCPVALPIFSDALEELRDLDVAYSRNAKEIEDSKRMVLLDADRLMPGTKAGDLSRNALPDYVKIVDGDTSSDSNVYHEVNPELNTDTRLSGINALLSQIGYKVGFSNGYFVFNEATGIQTATGVEAEQQRTIQFIKDCRDQLESCLGDLIYALSKVADLYQLAPIGNYEIVYDFGDITYNKEEDRARWWGYVQAGKVPAWMFFVKFEGMTEKDAKAMTEEARPKEPKLFGGEE